MYFLNFTLKCWTLSYTNVLMFELFMYVYSCNALSARFFDVDRALNFYFMIMIMTNSNVSLTQLLAMFWRYTSHPDTVPVKIFRIRILPNVKQSQNSGIKHPHEVYFGLVKFLN